MDERKPFDSSTLSADLLAGLVVFLIALPLCLGVAIASKVDPLAGVLAGAIGGLVVGSISRSHTSVSGPSPGLAAVVLAQVTALGSVEAFLAAVVIAGCIQIALGVARMGFIAEFFPSSVIKGLLAAIGIILILKQLPHLVGIDLSPQGDFAFHQANDQNTFTAILHVFSYLEPGALVIGLGSLLILLIWDRIARLKTSFVPAPLVVVIFGIVAGEIFRHIGEPWLLDTSHLVQVPIIDSWNKVNEAMRHPAPSAWLSMATWQAGFTLAVVASLETLLNLEAADRIDPLSRTSPPNRELVAQGIGNIVAGLLGGTIITSVIVRSSVNVNAGAKTKVSTIVHGALLLGCVALLPTLINRIPLSCLAAILFFTGVKLASFELAKAMWAKGKEQFLPFACTVAAIVLTDLLNGVIIGLAIASGFILWSNVRQPLRRIVEKHIGGDVLHLELPNQVSFLNRSAVFRVLEGVKPRGHVLIDAQETDYIDPDVLELIRDFKTKVAPSRGIEVSMVGFHERYRLDDSIQFVDYSTREIQSLLTPGEVLKVLIEGHERFLTGKRLRRDSMRQIDNTSQGQFPLAVVLSCIDSRTTAELIFDLGVGDIFSIRIAGNIAEEKVLGSMEYACAVAGAKLILVMGHTKCGAITAAVNQFLARDKAKLTGCCNLDALVAEIQKSLGPDAHPNTPEEKAALIEEAASRNILRTVGAIHELSPCLNKLEQEGKIAIVALKYDVATGRIKFLSELPETNLPSGELPGAATVRLRQSKLP